MKTLVTSYAVAFGIMLSSVAVADNHGLYDYYGYGSRYNNPRVVYPDNVQLYIMQQQQERMQKENHDYAVRQGLKDAWRVDGGGGGFIDVPVRGGY